MGAQVRSKARVKQLGEVFTNPREVNAMLDMIPEDALIDGRVLEPSCGNGNFLVEILRRKVEGHKKRVDYVRCLLASAVLIDSVSQIYGVDIDPGNVAEARERMRAECAKQWPHFLHDDRAQEAIDIILDNNLVVGDALKPDTIEFPVWQVSRNMDKSHSLTAHFYPMSSANKDGAVPIAVRKHEELVALRERRRLGAMLDDDGPEVTDADPDDGGL